MSGTRGDRDLVDDRGDFVLLRVRLQLDTDSLARLRVRLEDRDLGVPDR